jgi:hypothetical protein
MIRLVFRLPAATYIRLWRSAALIIVAGIPLCFLAVHYISSNKNYEWTNGGNLSSASMSRWMEASARERVATAANFAARALKLRHDSSAGMHEYGAVADLRTYSAKIEACISNAAGQPPEITEEHWSQALEQQDVNEIGAACALSLLENWRLRPPASRLEAPDEPQMHSFAAGASRPRKY